MQFCAAPPDGVPIGISGTSIRARPPPAPLQASAGDGGGNGWGGPEERLLRPLPHWGDPDLRSLAAAISRDIFTRSTGVSWTDVVALEEPKRLLKVREVYHRNMRQRFCQSVVWSAVT
jgi:hypothetical protein